MSATDLLAWGIVAHLVADWLLQPDWIATNKASLRHPAAWVHGAIHILAQIPVFGWAVALAIGASHMLIDTRRPLSWYRDLMGIQGTEATSVHVAIWTDQVLHILTIALAALAAGSLT